MNVTEEVGNEIISLKEYNILTALITNYEFIGFVCSTNYNLAPDS